MAKTIDLDKVRRAIDVAKANLVLDHPFFASIAIRMPFREDATVPTMCTDGSEIIYNPAFVASLSSNELKGVLAHEAMHVASEHHIRIGDREHFKWNIAADYAINDIISNAGLTLPKGCLTGQFKDMAAEEIYAKLPDPPKGKGGGGEGDGQGQGNMPDPGGCGGVKRISGKGGGPPSKEDIQKAIADNKITVAQAFQAAKSQGRVPAGVERMVDELLNPKLDWREILRRFVNSCAKNDYNWSPPNRRFVHMGYYLPSMRSDDMSEITVAVDTSGSIGTRELEDISGEIRGIIESYGPHVTVIYCDADVANVEEFDRHHMPERLDAKGGGGTDFKPVFKWIEEHGLNPNCVIYLTDGYCDSFPRDPGYPVIWGVIGGNDGFTAPFGEVFQVN